MHSLLLYLMHESNRLHFDVRCRQHFFFASFYFCSSFSLLFVSFFMIYVCVKISFSSSTFGHLVCALISQSNNTVLGLILKANNSFLHNFHLFRSFQIENSLEVNTLYGNDYVDFSWKIKEIISMLLYQVDHRKFWFQYSSKNSFRTTKTWYFLLNGTRR